MVTLYADTSMIVRAYLPDEPDHRSAHRQLFGSGTQILSSELARLEFAAALATAERSGRLSTRDEILRRFDADAARGGPVRLLALASSRVVPVARRLVLTHRLRTLDAIHLAVALEDARRLVGGELIFVTSDQDQATAARAEGLATA